MTLGLKIFFGLTNMQLLYQWTCEISTLKV